MTETAEVGARDPEDGDGAGAARGRRAVIGDVARLAGVSVPTVSRVLTGSIPVSEEKRARVLEAIAQLNYRPNSVARSLRWGERRMVAIMSAGTERYGYARAIAGAQAAAQAHGYAVVISAVRSADPDDVQVALGSVLDQQVAGIVVIDFDPIAAELLNRIPRDVPTVAASGFSVGQPGFDYAFVDEYSAGREATRYLLDLGHSNVHFLGLFPLTQYSGRYEGWLDALAEAGIEAPEVMPATVDLASGYAQGLRIAADRSITAVFCSNDGLAHAALRALTDQDIRVPGDVSIVGWDDQPFTQYSVPSLTTVAPDYEDLGRRAFAMLLERVSSAGAEPRRSVSSPAIIKRESTAPPSRR